MKIFNFFVSYWSDQMAFGNCNLRPSIGIYTLMKLHFSLPIILHCKRYFCLQPTECQPFYPTCNHYQTNEPLKAFLHFSKTDFNQNCVVRLSGFTLLLYNDFLVGYFSIKKFCFIFSFQVEYDIVVPCGDSRSNVKCRCTKVCNVNWWMLNDRQWYIVNEP